MQTQTPLLTHHTGPDFIPRLLDEIQTIEYPECEDFVLPRDLDECFLGCGYFSSVWAIPGEPFKVLKVSHRESDACRHYLRWVFDQPHPAAPKVHSIGYYGNLMYVAMDRYESIGNMSRERVPGYAVLQQADEPDPAKPHEVLCEKIRNNFTQFKFDLHCNNVMIDRKGNYIITDPVSFTYRTDGEGYVTDI